MIFTGPHYFFRRVRSRERRCNAIALVDDSIRESPRWLSNPLVACIRNCVACSNQRLAICRYAIVLVPPTAM
ncbi:hypothetical protein LMG29542_06917 [Paraburkholderia humisilvae]|uniref:Uncharacterized protein n=1 Tax=Paraburkholderia humisilvae TaxID=627669 RepID=A0A6J5F171_9BURK|nr:hypothetical protein LMG29542_06917 [Paraburkholderia humisilvae]